MSDETLKVIVENDNKYIARLKKDDNCFLDAGYGKRTLVNSLIGYNDVTEYEYELKKLIQISEMKEPPEIVTDLSTKKVKRNNTLWYKIVNETPFISTTLPIYLAANKHEIIDENELLEMNCWK